MARSNRTRTCAAIALAAGGVMIAGCSPTASVDPSGSPSPTESSDSASPSVSVSSPTASGSVSESLSPSRSASGNRGAAPCTSEAIAAALPSGASIVRFTCDGRYAGAVYKTANDEAAAVLYDDGVNAGWTEDKTACSNGTAPQSMQQFCVS